MSQETERDEERASVAASAAAAGVGGAAAGAAAAGRDVVVSGTVWYRERIALPPEGVVATVQLRDVSKADAAAPLLAEHVIETPGQVPIEFSLHVERAVLEPPARASLSAQIVVDGRLAWVSDTHNPVTLDAPTTGLSVMVVAA